MLATPPAASGPPLAAGVAISPHLASLMGVIFIACVLAGLAVWALVWLQHGALKKRVVALEDAFREDRARGRRIEEGVVDLKGSLKHTQDLLNIVLQENIRAGR